jgi:hypothetical protein
LTRGLVSARETPVEKKANKILIKEIKGIFIRNLSLPFIFELVSQRIGKEWNISPLLLKLLHFLYQDLKVRTRIDVVDVDVTDNSLLIDNE